MENYRAVVKIPSSPGSFGCAAYKRARLVSQTGIGKKARIDVSRLDILKVFNNYRDETILRVSLMLGSATQR